MPPYFHQASVWIDLLNYFEWKQVIIIHSMDEEGRTILSRFQALAETQEIKVSILSSEAPAETQKIKS